LTDDQPDPVEERAKLFDKMAAHVRLNRDAKFGGAFLMVPPDGDPVELIILGNDQPAIFWSSVKTLAEMALDAANKLNRQLGFGR
jgi:hypothetical protein